MELGWLALEIGVEVSQLPVVLIEPSFLNFTNINAALSKLRLKDAQILLSELQLQAGDFLGSVALAQTAGLYAGGGAGLPLLFCESGLCYFKIYLSGRDFWLCLGAGGGDLHPDFRG